MAVGGVELHITQVKLGEDGGFLKEFKGRGGGQSDDGPQCRGEEQLGMNQWPKWGGRTHCSAQQ